MSYHSHVPQASDMSDMRAMYQVNIPFGIESAQSSEHIKTNLREKAGQIAQNPVCAVSRSTAKSRSWPEWPPCR